MIEKLEIHRGGRLISVNWVVDKISGKGSYVSRDVTEHATNLLFERCELADDVTLQDVLLILKSNLQVFDALLGNHCQGLVTEGLVQAETIDEIEYLELYWFISSDDETYGHLYPSFHGVGFPDVNSVRTIYGLSVIPVNMLACLPLKLNPVLKLFKRNNLGLHGEELELSNPYYSLGNILFGIVWELSFFGSPVSREKFVDDINRRVQGLTDNIDVIKEEK